MFASHRVNSAMLKQLVQSSRTLCKTRTFHGATVPIGGTVCPFDKVGHTSQQIRCLATSDNVGSPAAKLVTILSREIDEENSNRTTEIPDELAQIKREIEKEWRLDDGVGDGKSAVTRLFKREAASNGAKVMVEFHCQDTEDGAAASMGLPEENTDGAEAATAIRFSVTVTKMGKSLVYECLSEEGEMIVESAMVKDADSESPSTGGAMMGVVGSDAVFYQGPAFAELTEDLQEMLIAFVGDDCGVDAKVCVFIQMYADFREQLEYVKWLNAVKKLVQ